MHIITRLILGGAQENTVLTVEGLADYDDFEPILVTGPALGPEGELLSRARRNGVRLILIDGMRRSINPVADIRVYRRLCRLIREERPDIVHTHSSKAGILGRKAAHRCGVPVIVHTIHGLPFHPYQSRILNLVYENLERRAAKRSDLIITVADTMKEKALAAGIAGADKFETIYSGLQASLFRPIEPEARRAIRKKFGFGETDKVICKIARLFHLKGHRYLFDAMPAVIRKIPNIRLLLAGDGILRNRFEQWAKEGGIADRVFFCGLVSPEEIGKYIGASDVVVHCSLREGLARVLPQALLCEIPVVSYDIDGAREVVKDGLTGRLITPETIKPLADAIIDILSDKDRADAMGRNGRKVCEKMFDHKKMVSKIAAAYRRLLVKKGAG